MASRSSSISCESFRALITIKIRRPLRYYCIFIHHSFMEHIDRVGKEDYVPTIDDILHARVRTTGVHSLTFHVDDLEFQCIDVGGQRNERKKWISHFDNVDAILFLA